MTGMNTRAGFGTVFWMRRLASASGLCAGLWFGGVCFAQPAGFERERALEADSLTYESFARAWDLVERSLSVHGGASVEEAFTDVALSFSGSGTRTISLRSIGEEVAYQVRGAVAFSALYDAAAFIEEVTVGSDVFRGYTHISRDQLLHVPVGQDLPNDAAVLEDERRRLEMLLPYHWLSRAKEARESLRWLGSHERDGRVLGAVSFGDAQDAATLLIDLERGELRRVEMLTTHFVQGDASGWVEFDEYQEVRGHLLPMVRRERSVEGQSVRRAEIRFANIQAGVVLPPNIFNLPQELRFANPRWSVTERAVVADAPVAGWQTIAPGVHTVDLSAQANTQVVVIERGDGCTVFNSPLTDELATQVLRSIAENLPGKPVREVVCATYHPRFAGGLRTYLAAGARVVTTPANRAYIETILTTPHRLVDGVPSVELGEGMVVLVDGVLTLGEGEERLELHDIGEGSGLTDSYLVGWHPGSRIVLSSDLFAVLERMARPASARTQGLARWLAEERIGALQFVPTSPVNDHKRVMHIEDLYASLDLAGIGRPDVGPRRE